jgi:hypothetical protein
MKKICTICLSDDNVMKLKIPTSKFIKPSCIYLCYPCRLDFIEIIR